ncbi:MAG: DNA primase, partial [Candidatus Krumholzibacteriia bacterium]
GKDPADVVIEDGVEAMQQMLKEGIGYIPFLKSLADRKGGDRESSERALRQALGTIAGIKDPLRREYVLQEAAEVFGLTSELLREEVRKEAASQPRPRGQVAAKKAAPSPTAVPAQPERPVRKKGAPAVRRLMAQVNAASIELDMFGHVLRDESGQAARVFLAEWGDFSLRRPESTILASELKEWEEHHNGVSPREFIVDRWNQAGDGIYRGFVSQLMNNDSHPTHKEPGPESVDFARVVRDCLGRLKADWKRRKVASDHHELAKQTDTTQSADG